jgi:hypothetical protein
MALKSRPSLPMIVLLVVGGVPLILVLYLLSVGPACWLWAHDWISFDAYAVYRKPASWMTLPADFDIHNPPKAALLYWDYVNWWGHRV